MAVNRALRPRDENTTMKPFTSFVTVMLILIFFSAFYLVISFKPPTKEQYLKDFQKISEDVDPFRKNLSECAHQVKASMGDIEKFVKGIPQTTSPGKCLIACILKRHGIIKANKIFKDRVMEVNKAVWGDDVELMSRLEEAVTECSKVVKDIFEICDYASTFNDCMHIQLEHLMNKLNMDKRMEAVGQMTADPDQWTEEDDELLQLTKDEL